MLIYASASSCGVLGKYALKWWHEDGRVMHDVVVVSSWSDYELMVRRNTVLQSSGRLLECYKIKGGNHD